MSCCFCGKDLLAAARGSHSPSVGHLQDARARGKATVCAKDISAFLEYQRAKLARNKNRRQKSVRTNGMSGPSDQGGGGARKCPCIQLSEKLLCHMLGCSFGFEIVPLTSCSLSAYECGPFIQWDCDFVVCWNSLCKGADCVRTCVRIHVHTHTFTHAYTPTHT